MSVRRSTDLVHWRKAGKLFKGKGCQTCNFTGMKGRDAKRPEVGVSVDEERRALATFHPPTIAAGHE